jgi:hypothetical protein
MGFFDSTSVTSNPTVVPSLSGTGYALGNSFIQQSNISPVFSANSSGNYAPSYSLSSESNPTVNSTTNLSLQVASNSPGASLSASQTATSGTLWNWVIAIAAVIGFIWWYKHR